VKKEEEKIYKTLVIIKEERVQIHTSLVYDVCPRLGVFLRYIHRPF
jgi:hypothetical protein